LLFAFRLLLLVDLTPAVLALPLSLVKTPVFDETVLLFAFAGMFALASTTPWRGGLPAALALLALVVLLVLLSAPHPARVTALASANASAKLRCIMFCPLLVVWLLASSQRQY
jgi:hypothetical protein